MSNPEENLIDKTDPIVKEIPIFLSKQLQDRLYIVKYPIHSKEDLKNWRIKQAHFKPENQEVKIEVGMDTGGDYFDAVRAEDIAEMVDGPSTSKKSGDVHFESGMVDKMILTSNKMIRSPAQKYALCAYNGKELHLTPVKGILELQPSVPHLNKLIKRSSKKTASGGANKSDDEAGPSSAQQVTVKFYDDEEEKKKRESYRDLLAKRAQEKWVECEWVRESSTRSHFERLQLFATSKDEINQAFELSKDEYIKLLVPKPEHSTMEPTLPSHMMSLHALRELSLHEQCRLLLKDAQIMQFNHLLMVLAGEKGVTSEALLKIITKVAVLVRGNWVVKSEIIYPAETFSRTSGVPADIMCHARDYVLYLFTKNEYIVRKKVSSVMRIPSEEVLEIFKGISTQRKNKGWELMLPNDTDFTTKHIDIVKDQARQWDEWFLRHSSYIRESSDRKKRHKSTSKSISEDSGAPGTSGTTTAKRNGQIYNSSDDSGTEKNKSPVVARKRRMTPKLDSGSGT